MRVIEEGIFPARLSDFYEVNRIQQAAFATPWSTDLIRASIANGRYEVRVLRAGDAPVAGFYIAHCAHGKSNLDNLAVDTPLRGRGLGTQLLLDWIESAHGTDLATLSLQVNTTNLRAQKLYKGFDFKATRLLPGYYPNGEDAYQMECSLRPSVKREPLKRASAGAG